MAKAMVTFFKCIQDSPEFGSDSSHMVSRVFFKLEIEGRAPVNLEADIKQPVTDNFESEPIEVSRQPHKERGLWEIRWPRFLLGYTGPFNYPAFRECAAKYYRSLFGAPGPTVQSDSEEELDLMVLDSGATISASKVRRERGVRRQRNVYRREMRCELEIDCGAHGWSGWRINSRKP